MPHSLEDRICVLDVEEQKRNRLCDAEAEAGIDVRSIGDPYTPYASPGLPPEVYADPFNQSSSQAHVPLVANASSPQQEISTTTNTRTVNRSVLMILTTGVD